MTNQTESIKHENRYLAIQYEKYMKQYFAIHPMLKAD